MIAPRTQLYLSHAPGVKVQSFAYLSALEAGTRGILLSVMPLALYRELGDAVLVSRIYFFVGIGSLMAGLLVPFGTRFIPRRWMMTLGCCFYLAGTAFALVGGAGPMAVALLFNAIATITVSVCLSAYLLDYFARADLGRTESLRMFYSAAMWGAGPVAGVWLLDIWRPAPFLIAGAFALAQLATFWWLRLGNGKQITRARGPATNPVGYLGRFLAQPRLIAGWLFAVIRSCGWWVYVVYLPIFCIENGLGDRLGGLMLSVTNALLFFAPIMLAVVQKTSVRWSVRLGFGCASLLFIAAWLIPVPPLAVAALFLGSIALVLLDVAGSLPFLMGVKPSERTEMAAVYSSYRDVSGILTPGVAWLVLLVSPVAGVFVACGAAMGAAWVVAARLHPRLGAPRAALNSGAAAR